MDDVTISFTVSARSKDGHFIARHTSGDVSAFEIPVKVVLLREEEFTKQAEELGIPREYYECFSDIELSDEARELMEKFLLQVNRDMLNLNVEYLPTGGFPIKLQTNNDMI